MSEDRGPNLSEFEPSWLTDGDLSGGSERDPNFDYYQSYDLTGNTVGASGWDVNVRSRQNDTPDVPPPVGGCITDAGDPPGSGTYVLGSVDGTCQWIDTTTC